MEQDLILPGDEFGISTFGFQIGIGVIAAFCGLDAGRREPSPTTTEW